MTDLNELLERCKAATGPDRGLDYDIDKVLGLNYDFFIRPRFTASIDAALDLVERMLPDTVRPGFQQNPDRSWSAAILRVQPDENECPADTAPTAPLAILTALLQALNSGAKK